jgi:hypothetical protein
MRPVPARPTSSISTANHIRHSHPTRPIRRRDSLRLAGVSLEVAIRSGPDPWYGREQSALDRSSDQVPLPTLLSTPCQRSPLVRGHVVGSIGGPRSDRDSGASAGSFQTAVRQIPCQHPFGILLLTRRRPSNGRSALVGRGNGRRSARRAICSMTAKRLRRRMAQLSLCARSRLALWPGGGNRRAPRFRQPAGCPAAPTTRSHPPRRP